MWIHYLVIAILASLLTLWQYRESFIVTTPWFTMQEEEETGLKKDPKDLPKPIKTLPAAAQSLKKKQPLKNPKVRQKQTRSLTTFAADQIVTFSNNGQALGYEFHPDNTDNMCDLTYPADRPGQFMLTKSGAGYSIKANCDGDGKFTSYLADNATDLIQPKRTAAKETWYVECPSAKQGCSIQATKSKKYLVPTDSGPSLSSKIAYWTVFDT